MKPIISLSVYILISFSNLIQQQADKALQSIVQAERDFGNTAENRSTKEAFLSVLGEDAILFRPEPVNGKKWMASVPVSTDLLTWEPIWAEIAQAADIGYTTGPFIYFTKKTDSIPAGYGHYVSIWKKQGGNGWKLIMDVGINHSKPENKSKLTFPERQNTTYSAISQRIQETFVKAEQNFIAQLKEKGIEKTYTGHIISGTRLYRNGIFPLVGVPAIQSYIATQTGKLESEMAQSFLAKSGDLGYTYGSSTYKPAKGEMQYSNYIRIWKKQKDDSWKIVLDIHTPRPAPK